MSTTRFTDAVTALLAAYAAAAPLAGIPVYDGAIPAGAFDVKFVIVGHDGSLAADGTFAATAPAGNYVQAWTDMTTGRQENGWVNCVAVSQTGEVAGLADCRTGLDTLLTATEDAITGAGATHLTFDGVSDGRLIYRQGPNGAAAMCAYRVTYSAPWD